MRYLISTTDVSGVSSRLTCSQRVARKAFHAARDDWRNISCVVEQVEGNAYVVVASFDDGPLLED